MQRALFSLTMLLASTLPAIADETKDAAQQDLECTLYTKPYTSDALGAYALPDNLKWKVLTHYVGRNATGDRIVDPRLTLVLCDDRNRFWPVIAKCRCRKRRH